MAPQVRGAGREAGVAWPAVRAPARRWFVIALLVAAIAHLPAMPFDPLFLARILLHTPTPETETPAEDAEVLVPVDLDLLADTPRTEDAPPTDPNAKPADPSTAPGPAPEPSPAAPDSPSKQAGSAAPPSAKANKDQDIYDDLDTPRRRPTDP